MNASVGQIETFGLVDGPGIRTVIFLNGCSLRCKFCHNPEMFQMGDLNYSSDDIVKKVLRSKPYFKNGGGVTFSGGEPLLQYDFLVDVCKKLKNLDINIAIDTAGIGLGNYSELLKYIDYVLLDVKGINRDNFLDITSKDSFNKYLEFINELNNSNVKVWIRQVIIPGINDNIEYILNLSKFLKDNIKNIDRVDFLPYHKMALEKYKKLGLKCPYEDIDEMDKDKCNQLYQVFKEDFYK